MVEMQASHDAKVAHMEAKLAAKLTEINEASNAKLENIRFMLDERVQPATKRGRSVAPATPTAEAPQPPSPQPLPRATPSITRLVSRGGGLGSG